MSFDSVIEEKIGFGKTQYIPFAFLCLVDMNDGSQLVLSSYNDTQARSSRPSSNRNGT